MNWSELVAGIGFLCHYKAVKQMKTCELKPLACFCPWKQQTRGNIQSSCCPFEGKVNIHMQWYNHNFLFYRESYIKFKLSMCTLLLTDFKSNCLDKIQQCIQSRNNIAQKKKSTTQWKVRGIFKGQTRWSLEFRFIGSQKFGDINKHWNLE